MYTYLSYNPTPNAFLKWKKFFALVYISLIFQTRIWAVLVTFQVDMSQMVISPNGVHLAGSFQGWDPSTYAMTDIGGGIFAMTLDLPPGNYEFKFINGNVWGTDESVPAACGLINGLGVYDRTLNITADISLPAYCFGQCAACGQADYVMNGNATSLGGNCYQVTPATQWQNGAFWNNTQIDLNVDFNLQFEINLGLTDSSGADGVVFVLQRLGSNVLGASGGGMGYSSFGQSMGIEFDTFQNLEYNDPPYDHLSIEINGDVNHYTANNISWPVQMSSTNVNTEDGLNHTVSIDWKASAQTMNVFFDCEFRLQATYDMVNEVFGGQSLVFWGFTGATGNLVNAHIICATPAALLSASYEICPGSNVMINAGSSTNQIYNWSPVTYLSDPTIVNPIASPNVTTEYQVSYLDLCNVPVTKNITVNVLESGAGCFFLPLALLDFNVNVDDKHVNLDWLVSDETDIAGYMIESAAEDMLFWPVAYVPVKSNALQTNEYNAQTVRSIEGRYYRLSQVDQFGNATVISDVVYVEGHMNRICDVFFEQESDEIRVVCKPLTEPLVMCVYSVEGKLLNRQTLEPEMETLAVQLGRMGHSLIAVCFFTKTGELIYSTKLVLVD